MVYDLHTHTQLSDGEYAPTEMLRQAVVNGCQAYALTDHAATLDSDLPRIIPQLIEACALARKYWNILAIPGIELTQLPAGAIAETAKKAKELGAWIVVVHGETIVEPVEKGTNMAALSSPDVDILAHPGFITLEEAKLAAKKGIFLEITARKGHSLTNGHVAKMARLAGARMLVDSDAHKDSDILTEAFASAVALGAGLNEEEAHRALSVNPEAFIKKLLKKYKA
jgi:putative hydrolase